MYTDIHSCIYMYTYIYVCMHIYIYIYIYMRRESLPQPGLSISGAAVHRVRVSSLLNMCSSWPFSSDWRLYFRGLEWVHLNLTFGRAQNMYIILNS